MSKFHINSLYSCLLYLYTVATLPWEMQKSIFLQYYSYILQIIYVISEENKLLLTYPPHLKNVTSLPCKMHNFLPERDYVTFGSLLSQFRLSSVCRLSVCNVGAPYSGGWTFWQNFFTTVYAGHPLTSMPNFTKVVPGEPLRRGR